MPARHPRLPGRRASPPTRSSTRTPAIDAILERYIGNQEFSNLPRKFKTAISGCAAGRRPRDQRHLVRRRRAPRARPGLRPLGRRRAVDQPDARPAARRLGAARRGPRRLGRRRRRSSATTATAGCGTARGSSSSSPTGASRSSARCWRTSTCTASWSTARPRRPAERPIDHVGVHPQKDGRYYVGVAPAAGRVSGTTLVALADARRGARLAAGCGSPPQQKIVVLDVPDDRGRRRSTPALDDARACRPSRRRGAAATMACTGIEFCKLAIVETKARADRLVDGAGEAARRRDLDVPITDPPQRLPELLRPHPGRGHRPQGQIVTDAERQPGRGLPGPPRRRPRARRRLRPQAARAQGHRPPSCRDYVERVVRRFVDAARAGERFAQWVARADEEDLKMSDRPEC